jgi:phage FluMu gp28-like protein
MASADLVRLKAQSQQLTPLSRRRRGVNDDERRHGDSALGVCLLNKASPRQRRRQCSGHGQPGASSVMRSMACLCNKPGTALHRFTV